MTALAFNFASASMFAVRNDSNAGSNPTPVQFGVLQKGEVKFAGTNKELFGQYQFPQDVARGPVKVTGKATSAQLFSNYFDLFFGQGVTIGAGTAFALNEAHSIPAPSGPYTVTTTNSGNFAADWGVRYAATGIPFQHVASLTAAGQYTYSAGVYTFDAADASAAVQISYEYTSTAPNELILANQLMGSTPTFSLVVPTSYKGNIFNIHLNACISESLSFPFSNQDYSIPEFDFQAYADASNNLGKITLSQ
jgi:hypothetical protein